MSMVPEPRMGSFRLRRGSARNGRRTLSAFTLLETALAIVIVGTGVLSILYAQQAFHTQNEWSTHTSTATYLANEVREMMTRMPRYDPVTGNAFWGPEDNELTVTDFDDLDDFDGAESEGAIFSAEEGTGPLSAMRQIIPNMTGWAQHVIVFNVQPNDISAPGDENLNGLTNLIRVEVIVTYQGIGDEAPTEVTRLDWISSS